MSKVVVGEKTLNLFFAAFKDEIGLTEKQALKLGACFGSGMRKGEVCGACTGIDRLQRSHEPGSENQKES